MVKEKRLSDRQLNVIEELFACELDEQAVLNKYNVSRHLYNKWLADKTFSEQLEKRIAATYRRVDAYLARHAPQAAAKLVQLTNSKKTETARKACLNIISGKSPGGPPSASRRVPPNQTHQKQSRANTERRTRNAERVKIDEIPRLSAETAGKLLAVLAMDKSGPAEQPSSGG